MFHWSGVLLNSVTWAKYAVSGIGPFTIFGGLFTGASEITFLLLMLLMAKGYTITRARLSTGSTVKITVFINLYIVVYVSLYIYQAEVSFFCRKYFSEKFELKICGKIKKKFYRLLTPVMS